MAAAVRALVCCHNFTDFGLPLLAHAVNLTRAAANATRFSGPLLRIAAAASSAPRPSFLCAGCFCRPRCSRTRHFGLGIGRGLQFKANVDARDFNVRSLGTMLKSVSCCCCTAMQMWRRGIVAAGI